MMDHSVWSIAFANFCVNDFNDNVIDYKQIQLKHPSVEFRMLFVLQCVYSFLTVSHISYLGEYKFTYFSSFSPNNSDLSQFNGRKKSSNCKTFV